MRSAHQEWGTDRSHKMQSASWARVECRGKVHQEAAAAMEVLRCMERQELMERQVHMEVKQQTKGQGMNERQRWCKMAQKETTVKLKVRVHGEKGMVKRSIW